MEEVFCGGALSYDLFVLGLVNWIRMEGPRVSNEPARIMDRAIVSLKALLASAICSIAIIGLNMQYIP